MATTIVPTSNRAVPVAFGYHPYLRLPGTVRRDLRLRLPVRRHIELDDRGLPNGATHAKDPVDRREPIYGGVGRR